MENVGLDNVIETLDKSLLYYLASPYSHKSTFIRNARYDAVNYAAAKLAIAGIMVFEPIASCHEKSYMFELPTGYEYWQDRDRRFITKSDALLVLDLPGLDASVGCQDEIAFAKELGKPVIMLPRESVFTKEELTCLIS